MQSVLKSREGRLRKPKETVRKYSQVLKVVAIAVSADFDLVYLTPNLKRRGNRANFA